VTDLDLCCDAEPVLTNHPCVMSKDVYIFYKCLKCGKSDPMKWWDDEIARKSWNNLITPGKRINMSSKRVKKEKATEIDD
jgi:hypothetical protein